MTCPELSVSWTLLFLFFYVLLLSCVYIRHLQLKVSLGTNLPASLLLFIMEEFPAVNNFCSNS